MCSARRAVNFLRGTGRSASGYSLDQILLWEDGSWESEHDFIQWVFPTDQPSRFNPEAPVLDAEVVGILGEDPACQENLSRGLERFLGFLGLTRGPDGIAFDGTPGPLWHHQNHNWLRISRCLRCLSLLGRAGEAAEFLRFLQEVPTVPVETKAIWAGALAG